MPRNLLLTSLILSAVPAAQAGAPVPASLYDLILTDINGRPFPLSQFKGKTLLIVNTASRCGFAPQMNELVKLKERYARRGLEILAVPSDDFFQELNDPKAIAATARDQYRINFPILQPRSVSDTDPLFGFLIDKAGGFPRAVLWNFEKFVVSPEGIPVARFRSAISPTSTDVTAAIEKQLAPITGK